MSVRGLLGTEDCSAEDSEEWKYLLAITASIFSSAGSAGGMVMQKFAHTANQNAEEKYKWPESDGIIMSPQWWFGAVILILVPMPFDLVALSLAPQSIIAPLAGVTIVMVQVIAPWVLGEFVYCSDWVATSLILVGCVLSTAFGSHCSVDYDIDGMMALFSSEVLWYAEVWWGFSIAVTYFLMFSFIPGRYPDINTNPKHEYSRRKWTSICYAYLGGAFAANQNIAFKAVGELLEKSMGYNDDSSWHTWEPYMMIIAVIVLSYFQLTSLNKGLSMWKAVKNLPIYNTSYVLMSSTYGGIYFQEYKNLSPVGGVFFAIGVLVICSGIGILALKDEEESDAADPSAAPSASTRVAPAPAECVTATAGAGRRMPAAQPMVKQKAPSVAQVKLASEFGSRGSELINGPTVTPHGNGDGDNCSPFPGSLNPAGSNSTGPEAGTVGLPSLRPLGLEPMADRLQPPASPTTLPPLRFKRKVAA